MSISFTNNDLYDKIILFLNKLNVKYDEKIVVIYEKAMANLNTYLKQFINDKTDKTGDETVIMSCDTSKIDNDNVNDISVVRRYRSYFMNSDNRFFDLRMNIMPEMTNLELSKKFLDNPKLWQDIYLIFLIQEYLSGNTNDRYIKKLKKAMENAVVNKKKEKKNKGGFGNFDPSMLKNLLNPEGFSKLINNIDPATMKMAMSSISSQIQDEGAKNILDGIDFEKVKKTISEVNLNGEIDQNKQELIKDIYSDIKQMISGGKFDLNNMSGIAEIAAKIQEKNKGKDMSLQDIMIGVMNIMKNTDLQADLGGIKDVVGNFDPKNLDNLMGTLMNTDASGPGVLLKNILNIKSKP